MARVFVFAVVAGPLVVVGPCWRRTGHASGLATRFLRNSAFVMAFRYNVVKRFLDMWETVVRDLGDLDDVLRVKVRCLTLCIRLS